LFLTILNPADYLAGFCFFIYFGAHKIKIMKKLITILLALLFITQAAQAQLKITNTKLLPLLKGSTTYVVIGEKSSDEAKIYMDLYKKYWTFSTPEFITVKQMKEHYKPGNSFITFSRVETSYYKKDGSVSYTSNQWDFWVCTEKGIKKKEGPYYHCDEVAKYFMTFGYGGEGDGRNTYIEPEEAIGLFTPGKAKNIIQWANTCLEKGESKDNGSAITDKDELAKVKKGILLIPNDIFESPDDAKKIMANYPHKFELVDADELDDKIYTTDDEFYYLAFNCNKLFRVVSVKNAKTGQVVFARNMIALDTKVHLLKKDIEALENAIGKN
jgi:hypothetical protein